MLPDLLGAFWGLERHSAHLWKGLAGADPVNPASEDVSVGLCPVTPIPEASDGRLLEDTPGRKGHLVLPQTPVSGQGDESEGKCGQRQRTTGPRTAATLQSVASFTFFSPLTHFLRYSWCAVSSVSLANLSLVWKDSQHPDFQSDEFLSLFRRDDQCF